MSKISLDIDLFCASCGKSLMIEDSGGRHVLVTPCFNCLETQAMQISAKVKYESGIDDTRKEAAEKLRNWKAEAEVRKKELANVTGGEY